MKNAILWTYRRVKDADMYSKQITLTYKGEDKLKTFYGGIISIIIMIALLINFCSSMYTLINRNDSKTYTKTVYRDTFKDTNK